MGSSGSQPVTQQTTQTKDPWISAQPSLQQIISSASNLYNTGTGYQPYTGNTTANPYNIYSTPGVNNIASLAMSEPQGSAALGGARDYLSGLIGSGGMSSGMSQAAQQYGDIYSNNAGNANPYLQGAIDQQVNKVNSSFSGAGRYGSGMHDAAVGAAVAPILAQDYAQRQQNLLGATQGLGQISGQGADIAGKAAQLIPTLDEARYSGAGKLLGLGDIQKQYEQSLLDQALKLYNAQQAYPWESLQRFAAIVQGAGSQGGSQITSTPGATQPSTLQRVLGGSLAGAGLGSSIFPGIGTGVGAVGGGLLGLL